MPDIALVERTELADFDEVASAPEVLDDRADVPAKPARLDRCAPDVPLVEETARVLTEVVALLEDDRPEVEVELELVLFCEEEFCR
jgi:hypothetical protein